MKKVMLTVLFIAGLASVAYADNWGVSLHFGNPVVPVGSFYYYDGPPVHRARVYAPSYYSAQYQQKPHSYRKHVHYRSQMRCGKCHW